MRIRIVCTFAGFALLAMGCGSRDVDQLGRVARVVAAKFDNLTGGAQERLAGGLQAAQASWSDKAPEVRVAERLRLDKQLAGADLLIDALSPGVVRLQGTVADMEVRRRAVDLAQSTLGVEKVVDEIKDGE